MSKTIYYLGAGASYGKRNKLGEITEGLPVVAELPKMFDLFRYSIKNAIIPDGFISLQGLYRTSSDSVNKGKENMLSDIDSIISGVRLILQLIHMPRSCF